ncbi:MAG: hypothetical protein HYT08_02680 [Candidatus Levybacteria bacterium]|nr:hypothetical protein [Candidatus Levybacteria bacterium]
MTTETKEATHDPLWIRFDERISIFIDGRPDQEEEALEWLVTLTQFFGPETRHKEDFGVRDIESVLTKLMRNRIEWNRKQGRQVTEEQFVDWVFEEPVPELLPPGCSTLDLIMRKVMPAGEFFGPMPKEFKKY